MLAAWVLERAARDAARPPVTPPRVLVIEGVEYVVVWDGSGGLAVGYTR